GGAAVLTLAGGLLGASVPMFYWLGTLLILSLVAGLAIIFTDLFMVHGGEEIMRATELLLKGGLSGQFWLFVVGLGIVAPIVLILWPSGSLQVNMIASVLVLIGSWIYENLWIYAGQSVPWSYREAHVLKIVTRHRKGIAAILAILNKVKDLPTTDPKFKGNQT